MPHKTPRRHKAQSALPPRQSNTATGSSTAPCPGFPLRASRSVCHNCMSSVTPCGNLRGFPGSPAHLFLHATACGLRRTSTPSPIRVLLCCLRCTLKPSASATSLFRSCTSASGSAISPTAYRILCLRLVHLVRPASRQYSAMDPRLDTGGWLALTRRGLPPRKMRQALPGAITIQQSSVRKCVRSSADRPGTYLSGLLCECTASYPNAQKPLIATISPPNTKKMTDAHIDTMLRMQMQGS